MRNTKNPLVSHVVEFHRKLVKLGKEIIFLWIPNHVGAGETVVDEEAKNALNENVSKFSVPYTDFKSVIL